jgi:hypothetical protein
MGFVALFRREFQKVEEQSGMEEQVREINLSAG